ncbi:MAG TPA: sigma-70 family RNA polymerase sigma factor [Verrucomicrobiae bacterium]
MSVQPLRTEHADTPLREKSDLVDPERWLDEYGDVLFSFAMVRVRERSTAQDLVQETFLAALKARGSFAGRSTERAWLFGILRNKLADYYRLQSREVPLEDPEKVPEEEGFFHASGPGKDGWISRIAPKPWAAPDASLVSKEFQAAFQECVSALPEKVAQVFLRREVDEIASEEICKEFGISPNNFWVMLHRARMGLRRCLEVNWFGPKRDAK